MTTAKQWLVCMAWAGLSGCNLAPVYQRPQPPVPAEFARTGPMADGLPTSSADGKVGAELQSWQAFVADAAMREVIVLALAHNRDLRLALANIEQARSLYGVQRAERLPTLSGDAGMEAGRSRTGVAAGEASAVQRTYSVDLGMAAFEIDLFGRMRNLSDAALESFLAARETQRAVRVSVIAETAKAYITLATDRQRLAIAQHAAELSARTLALTRSRQSNGMASGLDMRQAEISHQQSQVDAASYATSVARAENALRLLLGQEVPPHLRPQPLGEQAMTLIRLPASLHTEVLLERPDVRAAEHALMAQHANIGAARAAFFPRLSLSGATGRASDDLGTLFNAGTRTWSLVPSLSLPLFDGGANRANLDYAKASREAALATYEKTIQTAFREVADALALNGTIEQQVQAQSRLLHAAEQAFAIAQERYRVGSDTFLNLLVSQQTLLSARSAWADLQETRQLNNVSLYRALGGGATEPQE